MGNARISEFVIGALKRKPVVEPGTGPVGGATGSSLNPVVAGDFKKKIKIMIKKPED